MEEGRIIFIPAYGTDSSLYHDIHLEGVNENRILKIEWPTLSNENTFSEYAQTIVDAHGINHHDTIVGVSLGGIMAIEINKLFELKKIVLISSIKSSEERPLIFKLISRSKIYYLFSPVLFKFGLDLIVPFYGLNYKRYIWFRRVFKASDNKFLKWAMMTVVQWENEQIPSNIVHIHGDKDPLFPINNCKEVDHVILGGTHAMVRFQSAEISKILAAEILN